MLCGGLHLQHWQSFDRFHELWCELPTLGGVEGFSNTKLTVVIPSEGIDVAILCSRVRST